MKELLIWFRDNTAIPLTMAAVSAIGAGVHISSEVEPSSYQTLSLSWDTITPDVRSQVAEKLNSGGTISRKEYGELLEQLTVTYHRMRYDGDDNLDLSAERAKVQELVNNPAMRPYQPLSELKNMRPVSPGIYTSSDDLTEIHKEIGAKEDE